MWAVTFGIARRGLGGAPARPGPSSLNQICNSPPINGQCTNCRLPAFQCAWVHWTRKLAAEQSKSKSRGLFSVDSVVADGVTSQNFRHWSAEASSDRLLGSAKPGHTEPSDWSAAKKTEDCYQDKGWSCWILSGLAICVRDRPCFTLVRMKIEQNSCVVVKFNAILKLLAYYTPFCH